MTEQLSAPIPHGISTSADRPRPFVDVELIIPALNESARLPRTLAHSVEFLRDQPWSSRLVIVDNGSVDDTPAVARRVAAELAGEVPVEVVGCSRPGKGAAVRRGLLSSSSRFVGFFDADLATPVETLSTAVEHLEAGAAAVIASRHLPESSFVRPQQFGRRAGGAAFRLLARGVVPGVRDTQCGFKLFERDAAIRALVRCHTEGFAFDVELLHHVHQSGGRIVELPIAWTDSPDSRFHPIRDGVPSFGAILRMQKAMSA
ncbi:glycosyltransferase [Pseudonocardia sp. CA-142604]|uniref:glycosyltransferase n=1 Tax=Pseudonocardia sp. CA-142604 TaxID=3240024 RepID=UPI003D91E830